MLDLRLLEGLLEKGVPENLNLLFESIVTEISAYLGLPAYYSKFDIRLSTTQKVSEGKKGAIFSIGAMRSIKNGVITILIDQEYIALLEFIILREVYNIFVEDDLRDLELVQMVINQIIMNDLKKSLHLNEWRQLIRENLDNYDSLTKGISRLSEFDRLERFFTLKGPESSLNPTQFFFYYIQRNKSLIHNHLDDIQEIITEEFIDYSSKSMNNDEIIETLRCIINIFYAEKSYQNIISYKSHFQEYKDQGKLETGLSLRKFEANMRWIKSYSFIAPTYQINWKAINIDIIPIFLRFNPYLRKRDIFKVIETLPFFISPKISSISFAVELCGYIILPKAYSSDFINFLKKLKDANYILSYYCLSRKIQWHLMNLNYFREYFQKKRLINPTQRDYDTKYEIEFHLDFGDKFFKPNLSLLQFILLDRIQWFSISGLGFERRTETLNVLKSDLLNEIISQRSIIKSLKNTLSEFHVNKDLKEKFLEFLDNNSKFGFFFTRTMLAEYLTTIRILERILQSNPHVKNLTQFQELLNSQTITSLIEDNLILGNRKILKVIFRDFIVFYFTSKTRYQERISKYQKFSELMNVCYNLKIFNLDSIKSIVLNKDLVNEIYQKKEEKLQKSHEKYKLYDITSQRIDDLLNAFLDSVPPLISPLLISTIITKHMVKDYLELIVVNSEETRQKVEIIKSYFPRILLNVTEDLFVNREHLYIEISAPQLTSKEKEHLFSIFFNTFRGTLLYMNSFIWSGIIKGFSSKSFYDFDAKDYFYTADLFKDYFLFVKTIFGAKLKALEEKPTPSEAFFWSTEKEMNSLIKSTEREDYLRTPDLTLFHLNNLLTFSQNLRSFLLDEAKLKVAKQEYYFKNYVNSIKFLPAFHKFGLEQFYLFIFPANLEELDLELLLINSFQKIRYPLSLDRSHSLLIEYIMPYRNPNLSYLHWLVKSKKNIREYCAFFLKKVHTLFHLSFNLVSDLEGWNYSADKFKIYMQNILFNPKYDIHLPEVKTFDLGENKLENIYGPDSAEYTSLIHCYNRDSLDVKSYLGTKHSTTITHILNLLEKKLVFPYISYKNVDLDNKLHILLPNVKREVIEVLIKIFSFFNLGVIYEIEGEFYIHGFSEEIKFENGLFIKLYFPSCEVSEFFTTFSKLFDYLGIDYHMFLYDLADGNNLLKSIYGSTDFLKSYNPLKNLIWNDKDRIWINHKLFDEKFEKLYPDLLPREES